MYKRLLTFLRCPRCLGSLELEPLRWEDTEAGTETVEGLLHCDLDHWYPVTGGIPRMLPDSLDEHWSSLERLAGEASSPAVRSLHARRAGAADGSRDYDRRTRANFSLEWEHYELEDRTWGIELGDRVRDFFLDPLRLSREQLEGLVVLDAGCGNGSQSVAYTQFGLEVIAMDLSSGLEHGQAFRHRYPDARPERVHFVQGDLQTPPLAPASLDIIHSTGVLHHTPDTERTFRTLCQFLHPDGTFYVWLYSYEPIVTPVVNSIRTVTTRLAPQHFGRVANAMARPFQLFCRGINAVGVRSYPRLSRREAALALHDIFGAPFAHYHSFAEVERWYREEGFDDVWECNNSRRGFGACGRRSSAVPSDHPGAEG